MISMGFYIDFKTAAPEPPIAGVHRDGECDRHRPVRETSPCVQESPVDPDMVLLSFVSITIIIIIIIIYLK